MCFSPLTVLDVGFGGSFLHHPPSCTKPYCELTVFKEMSACLLSPATALGESDAEGGHCLPQRRQGPPQPRHQAPELRGHHKPLGSNTSMQQALTNEAPPPPPTYPLICCSASRIQVCLRPSNQCRTSFFKILLTLVTLLRSLRTWCLKSLHHNFHSS